MADALEQLSAATTTKSLATFAATDALPKSLSLLEQQIRVARTLNDVLLSRALAAPLCSAAVSSGTANAETFVSLRHGEQALAWYRKLCMGAAEKTLLKGQRTDLAHPASYFVAVTAIHQEPGTPPSSVDAYFGTADPNAAKDVVQQAVTANVQRLVGAASHCASSPHAATDAATLRNYFEDIFVEASAEAFRAQIREHGRARRIVRDEGTEKGAQSRLEADSLAPEGVQEWEVFGNAAWAPQCRLMMDAPRAAPATTSSSGAAPRVATRQEVDDFWATVDHPTMLTITPFANGAATTTTTEVPPLSIQLPNSIKGGAAEGARPPASTRDAWGTAAGSRLDFLKDSDDDAPPPPPARVEVTLPPPEEASAPNRGGRFVIDPVTKKLVLKPSRKPAAERPAPKTAATKVADPDEPATAPASPAPPSRKRKADKAMDVAGPLPQPQPRAPGDDNTLPTVTPLPQRGDVSRSEPPPSPTPTPRSGRATPSGLPMDMAQCLAALPSHVRMAAYVGLRAKGLVG